MIGSGTPIAEGLDMQPSFDELHSLPVADKLRLVERLWDDIAASDEPVPLPDWPRPMG